MKALKYKKVVPVPSALALSNPFGRYHGENEQAVRQAEIKPQSEVFRMIKKVWEEVADCRCDDYTTWHNVNRRGLCSDAREKIETMKKIPYTTKDVEKFSVHLAGYTEVEDFDKKSGLFLSALVNYCNDMDYVIHTRHLPILLSYVGYNNTKNLIVEGDAGAYLGEDMRKGNIVVSGNATEGVGNWMSDGRIIVKGNVDYAVGEGMEGGEIRVGGNAGNWVGLGMVNGAISIGGNAGNHVGGSLTTYAEDDENTRITLMKGGTIRVTGNVRNGIGNEMEGGEIHIFGEIGSLGQVTHGKIYHKGKLIIDR